MGRKDDMTDRFSILTGKGPEVLREGEHRERRAKALPKALDIPKKVKKLVRVWEMQDKDTYVALEVSPREATCTRCKRRIRKNTPRYKMVSSRGYWKTTELFHRGCSPGSLRRFVNKYPGRDLEKEAMEDAMGQVIFAIDTMTENKYRKRFVEGIISYLGFEEILKVATE